MPLLQRVATLIRANLNDLVDKAEDPERMLKQLLLDLQNQHMQVKTQVAMAIADQHLLEKRRAESEAEQSDFIRKAQLALKKNDEGLARTALARSVTCQEAAAGYAQQVQDQAEEVRLLRDALAHLENKLVEARAKADVLISRHRRSKVTARAAARVSGRGIDADVFRRTSAQVSGREAESLAQLLAAAPDATTRLEALDRDERVERLLADLREKALSTR